ncbi:class I SAM-dependent DNA methyltransferase [Chryseolinea lacunae]|uniref:Class I SAM-dependent methyltransferase n=1 Tax=Chryseolinea lacunae TaxID=2801331 RepID=A0ABS1KL04_9BACT|nr:class I SAM-dependent methyltransferase [Chryseolinea lacunae]MBL0740030.1 class I SAM-dependent methyltransferase [Chryseolinea lacunae]
MNTQEAYNLWASQYDSNQNKTRDLEGKVLQTILSEVPFEDCLEIGCGTGKNTEWLATKAKHLTSADLSENMLEKARAKITSNRVRFVQADITKPWTFGKGDYDLVTFSLVLEHIEHLVPIFEEVASALTRGGHAYVGELHPFKQYSGTKARFETESGTQVVECFNHNISDFIGAARRCGLNLIQLEEHFDDNNRNEIPRILTLLFQKA